MAISDCITIPLVSGVIALIDEQDVDLTSVIWHSDIGGYVINRRNNTRLLMHRLVLSRKLGRELKKGEFVDHINGNRADNRRSNLRLASSAQNACNRTKVSNVQFKGVRRISSVAWSASIEVDFKRHYLGSYATPELAARVYDKAAIIYHGEFAKLNFPDMRDVSIPDQPLKTSSRYIGVSRLSRNNKWRASIQINNKAVHIGVYQSELEAAENRDKYIRDCGLSHKLNFG